MQKTLRDVVVKAADKGEVTAVFSTFNVIDKDGDVTLPGAIADGTEVVISAYGHTSWDGSLPVGKGVIRTTDTEAILEGTFFLSTSAGRDTFEVVKELGAMGEWSYSLHNVVSKSGEMAGQPVNFLESISVKEVSPVLIGAGVNTRTLATKGLKFADEGDEVLVLVNAYLKRASEVVVLRAAKGRTPSDELVKFLKELDAALVSLRDLLDTKAEGTAEDIPEDVATIADDLRWGELFSSLTETGV